jgi:succinate dehydrogenase hydrophobic anchor subunit
MFTTLIILFVFIIAYINISGIEKILKNYDISKKDKFNITETLVINLCYIGLLLIFSILK